MVGPLGMPPWQAGLRAPDEQAPLLHRLAPRCTPGHANAVGTARTPRTPIVQQRVLVQTPRRCSANSCAWARWHLAYTVMAPQQLARRPADHGHRRRQNTPKAPARRGATNGVGGCKAGIGSERQPPWLATHCDGAVLLLGQVYFFWYSATHACTGLQAGTVGTEDYPARFCWVQRRLWMLQLLGTGGVKIFPARLVADRLAHSPARQGIERAARRTVAAGAAAWLVQRPWWASGWLDASEALRFS